MIVFIGLVVRMVASFTSMLCTELSCKERFFVALAWLPKATLQVGLSCRMSDIIGAQIRRGHEVCGRCVGACLLVRGCISIFYNN